MKMREHCREQKKEIPILNNPELPIDELGVQWMIVLKDTEESLIALFDKSGTEVKHCIWTKDPFLSFVLHNGSIHEFYYTEIRAEVFNNEDDKIERIKEVIKDHQYILKLLCKREKDVHKKMGSEKYEEAKSE